MTERVVPGATRSPRLPGAWMGPSAPKSSRLTVAGLPEALLSFSTAVRPSAVFAPTSQRSLPGCWQAAAAEPRRSPSSAV